MKVSADEYLLAVKWRSALQHAYATWVAFGRPSSGPKLQRLVWVADAHMRATMAAGV